ncbi:N-acetylglutamate synthase, GNAT family [Salinimicrobium catena]|uniref:N-acetylglutamate synthase, GNAT family n=1 Tax=Salinimicrobium catena TaxID=390640 RepID=A0A1H5MYF2_9FLAO|nr:GNAT family N-acetyltransferase [Salinimicrobium catena]SDL31475.1 N-acetylglutamate synthase, GNAT family [Salinimicrobium catena]SEE93767.1 N-acetylglutamate synthase, GNAT family [Salinimicrobium catena]
MMIRAYQPTDKEAVLQLIRLNTPEYFAPAEEAELSLYLDEDSRYYFVVEEDGKIIGAGGINFFPEESLARISRDLIHPDHQGRGIGGKLTQFRIAEIKKRTPVTEVQVRTSQLVYKFYEKQGFEVQNIVKDFWAPDYHLYDMRRSLQQT